MFLVCTFIIVCADGADSLALTPPMGWNSWNCFSCDVNEQQIRDMADLIVANGMRDAGYTYVNVDDCWQVGRDADGNIVVDSVRFPSWHKGIGRLYTFQRIEVWYLFLCRIIDLCRTSWKSWLSVSGCPYLC